MQLPPKKVKQMQKQIVDGQECEIEVEVEVVEERKCLFKFAPSIQVLQWFLWLPPSLSLGSIFLSHWHAKWHHCVISISIHHHRHHTYIPFSIVMDPWTIPSLSIIDNASNDVTIPFTTKCSIILPFNCHTLDLFFLVVLSAFSIPMFSGYRIWTSVLGHPFAMSVNLVYSLQADA
jgi:hypothetical protein